MTFRISFQNFILITALICLTGLFEFQIHAQESKSRKEDESASLESDDWVKEIKPGVKLYGRVPEFAEIGQTHLFDVSPDGQTIAFGHGSEVRFWDIEKKKVAKTIKTQAHSILQFSPDGQKLFISERSSNPQPVQVEEEDDEESDDEAEPAQLAAPMVAGKMVFSVWDTITYEKLATIDPGEFRKQEAEEKEETYAPINHISGAYVSPDGDQVALSYDNRTAFFDIQTGEGLIEIDHKRYSQTGTFTFDGTQFIDGSGKIFDIKTGEKTGKLPRAVFGNYMNSIKLNPKRNVIAVTAWGKELIVYDLEKKEKIELEIPKAKQQQLFFVEFSNNGKLLAGASYANWQGTSQKSKIFVWNIESGKLVSDFDWSGGYMNRMRFSGDGKHLFVKGQSQFGISKLEIGSKKSKAAGVTGNASPISDFCFSHDGENIVASSQAGGAVLFDLESGEPTGKIECQQANHLCGTLGGEYLVLGAIYNAVTVYDAKARKSKSVKVVSFQRPSMVSALGSFLTRKKNGATYESYAINGVTIAEDNEHFLVASRGRQNFRWEKFRLSSGTSVARKKFPMSDFWDSDPNNSGQRNYWREQTAAISPNGQYFAIINDKGVIFTIDAESGALISETDSPSGARNENKLFFSHDSNRLMSVSGNDIMAWEVESGEEAGKLSLGTTIRSFAVNSAGSHLVVVSHNNEIKVFDLDSLDEVFSKKPKATYRGVGISDDGEKIALAKHNCQFEVWDLDKLKD